MATAGHDKPYRIERCGSAEALDRLRAGEADGIDDILSAAEKKVFAGFKAEKRRKDWLGGRLAAKRLLQACLREEGMPLDFPEIEILNRHDGPPFARLPGAVEYRRRHLSLSHTSTVAAAALSKPGHLVGIDVEVVETRGVSFLELMAHESERDDVFMADPTEQTRVWTLKEAVSKVLGTGLSVGFWDIRFPTERYREEVPPPMPWGRPTSGTERRPEFHGNARTRWEKMGKPVIRYESVIEDSHVMSIAYTDGEANA